jgi:hypothetical protein
MNKKNMKEWKRVKNYHNKTKKNNILYIKKELYNSYLYLIKANNKQSYF